MSRLSRTAPATSRAAEPAVVGEDLPSYSPRTPPRRHSSQSARSQTEHTYCLKNRDGAPWLTLRLNSQASRAQSLPYFCKEDTVAGSVDLVLAKSDHIQAVVLKLWGQIMPLAKPNMVFWEDEHVLWNVNMGDPSNPSKDYQGSPWSPKLKGTFSWDYSIKLPTKISFASKDTSPANECPLPQSYTGLSHISYCAEVVVVRGKLRVDSKVWTNFAYIPRTRASPPCDLRRMAYQEGTPVLGPDIDPEGWHVLRPAWVAGSLFNSRKAEVFLKLAIAKPLEYARGTVIPLSLVLESDDTQALDLLAKPSVPNVALTTLERGDLDSAININGNVASVPGEGGQAFSRLMHSGIPGVGQEFGLSVAAVATWWAPDDAAAYGTTSRRLDGEIHLPATLSPSFEFWKVGVEYEVHLLPVTATGFTLESASEGTLISEKVRIVTDKSVGPSPRRYAPPGYEENKIEDRLKSVRTFFAPRVGKLKGGGFL